MNERKKIDQIDEAIAKLINERFKVVSQIKEIKHTEQITLEHKDREETIINQNMGFVDEPYKPYFLRVYKTLIEASKDFQKQ